MSDMICPFCQQELYYLAEDIYYCPNHQKYMGTEELWQELIRTRKALDLAFEMLKDIKNDPDTNNELTQEMADRLSEIKALIERSEE